VQISALSQAVMKRWIRGAAMIVGLMTVLEGCAAAVRDADGTPDGGWLTLAASSERSQPGCPVSLRVSIGPGAPEIVRGEVRWRVAHGKRAREGHFPLSLPAAAESTARDVEVAFKPPEPGVYRIDARVEGPDGRQSTARLYHYVAHVTPFSRPRACDADPSLPHEVSAP
jgi:hypothetical protein